MPSPPLAARRLLVARPLLVARRLLVGGVAAFAFILAYASPVETVDADAALGLVASQAVVERGSLRLDPYADHAGLAYEIRRDYRVRRVSGAYYPNSLGVPILSVPAVWVANRLGYDMLEQDDEFALQNILSAASCALLFLLLFALCRRLVEFGPSLVVATVSTFGTSVMSTGATALWNSNYSLIFTTLALYVIVARRGRGISPAVLGGLAALVVAGFVARPSAAFFFLALLVYLRGESDRRVATAATVGLIAMLVAVALPSLVPLPWMAAHYSPGRLQLTYPLHRGLYGVLASPSRGLLVFSPFVVLLVAGGLRYRRLLMTDRLYRLCLVWIGLHTLAVALNEGKWWGGHSFGPRMLVDITPALVVAACLTWLAVARRERPRIRRFAMVAYAALGLVAIGIHSGQALFNPATRLWNISPDIDSDPALAFDWRYPQFLASPATLDVRLDEHELRMAAQRRGSLPTYALGEAIDSADPGVIFLHWYANEGDWRWTRGERASIIVRLPRLPSARLYALRLYAGALGPQSVAVAVNGAVVGSFELAGFEPVWSSIMVPLDALKPLADNEIELRPSNPVSTANDSRALGLALRELRLEPVTTPAAFDDEPWAASAHETRAPFDHGPRAALRRGP